MTDAGGGSMGPGESPPGSGVWRANYGTLWKQVAQILPEQPAIWQDGHSLTYRELDDRAGRLAAGLASVGVGAGSRVALYLYSGPEYLEALFAAFKLSATPVNVNYRYQQRELADLLADAAAGALIFHGSLADRVGDVLATLPQLSIAVRVGDTSHAAPGAVDLDALLATHSPLERADGGPDDELFVYTGGTTGSPKGVVWRHGDLFEAQSGNVFLDAAGCNPPADAGEALRVVEDLARSGAAPRLVPVVPLMHATGLFNSMGTLSLGGTVLFPSGGSLDPAETWRIVQEQQATRMVIAGNAVAWPLADELRRAELEGRPYVLDTLEVISSSGAGWTDDLKRIFHERGHMTLKEVLASTEGGPYAVATTRGVGDLPTGFRLTPMTVVFDADGEPVPSGSEGVGALAYFGPMPRGYHGAPEKTAEVFRWIGATRYVLPGDFVHVSTDGSLSFLGRGSAVVNSGGEKVYPAEVEDALLTHPAVRDVAVVGTPDAVWGEAVTAVVVRSETTVVAQDLIDQVGAQLASYKKPRHVVCVDELPRAVNGKIDLRRVRDLAVDRVRSAPARP